MIKNCNILSWNVDVNLDNTNEIKGKYNIVIRISIVDLYG